MNKKKLSFTIDKDLFGQWKKYALKNSIDSSLFMEGLLRKYLKENAQSMKN